MSLFGQYIQERLNKSIVENDKGFATFYPLHDGMYIEDIYVIPDERHSGEASRLADQVSVIAKEKGMNRLYGSVKPSAKYATAALKVLLAYGFELSEAGPDAVIMRKEI